MFGRSSGSMGLSFSSISLRTTLARRILRGILALTLAFHVAPHALSQSAQKPGSTSAGNSSPFQEAETLLAQGAIDQAKQQIQEQLALHPNSVEGYNLLGIACTSEKDFSKALDAFQHALKLSSTSTKTHNNLGNLYVAEGKVDLAKEQFQQTLRISPSDRDANYNLGLLFLSANKPAEAIPHFLRIRSPNVETQFNLIRAYLLAAKTADGLKLANEVSAHNRSDVRLHFTLGLLLAAGKQYRPAQLELEKANALQPETPEILCNLGQVYLRSSDFSKAEVILKRAQKLTPDSADTLYLLGQVYADQSRPVDALDVLARAHKIAPDNPDITFLLARVSMTQNFFEDAIPLLESALKAAPERSDLHAALGESYFMSGKAEKAIEEFKTLIKVDPSARSYAFMGLSYRHLGRFDEARKYFEEGLKLDPHNVSCLFNLGYIEERQGNVAAAEAKFQQALKANSDFPEALLELANLRIEKKQLAEAAELLRRYVKVSRDPAPGYYKLAMVERSLHQTQAAQRDLSVFQTLSKDPNPGPYPYQHLFDYLNNRSTLAPQAKTQLDLAELNENIKQHPDQPQDLYLLAETYLKLGQRDAALNAITQLDRLSAADYRMQTGIGVLLARFRMYDEAIKHFQAALKANPDSDDVKFDSADAYFRKGSYADALSAAEQISAHGLKDDATLALLADIHAHTGDTTKAAEILRDAITRNPDNDQYYLSLALVQLRDGDVNGAGGTLQKGLARMPSSGKILWGLGLVSVLEGKTQQAADRLERAVDLLPEWAGSYSTLGLFYFQTGQITKAREVLDRFKGSNAAGALNIGKIEEALSKASDKPALANQPLPTEARQQLLQIALSLADRTL